MTSKLLLISLLNLAHCFTFENSKVTDSVNIIAEIPTLCFEHVKEEDFFSAKKVYTDKLLKDTINFKKQSGQLKLPLSEGYKIFQDSIKGIEDENSKEYKYLGQFKEIDFYIVTAIYWEHFEIYLVDKISGNIYSAWAVPSLSPDNKRIATILSSGLEGEPVGIQILSIDRSKYTQIEKLIEVDQRIWNPLDFVWETNNTLILKVTKPEDKKGQDFSYLRLKIN